MKTKPKTRTKSKPSVASSSSRLPGIDELNLPPENFLDYCSVIYGLKGVGKTSLIANMSPNSLVFMFEPRRRNLKIRMVQLDMKSVPQIEAGEEDPWKLFKELVEEAKQDPTISHIGIDTVDRCYKACMNSVCSEMGIIHPGGLNDFGNAWNAVKEEFRSYFDTLLASEELGVTFVSHCTEMPLEINTGETVVTYGPSCDNFAKEYLKQACDFAFFYGKHYSRRALHVRWTPDIWTACGVDDVFLTPSGEKIAAFEIPSASTAGQSLLDAYANNPSTKILKLEKDLEFSDPIPNEEDEADEEPKTVAKKKFKKR
jgi:hypothetical protein